MAARDRYTFDVICPVCGHAGEANVSEDDHPYLRDPGFRVDRLPEGFAVVKATNWRAETQVRCQCGHLFCL